MLQNRNIDITDFISFNSGGVVIADYDQVQAAIVRRYKNAYGEDIDLTNTTADGIFINNLALIINNILQSFKILYNNLNVDTASGEYLDMLCRLSNITRKSATKSSAALNITCTQNTTLPNGTIFIDNIGNEWVYTKENYEDPDIQLTVGDDPVQIRVTCTQYGPIEAPANSIYQTLEASYLTVEQPAAADLGSNTETDEELRARRDQSNGSQGITIQESLVGALLDVDGIQDAQIITNNTASNSSAQADTTVLTPHSIYVIIRKRENVTINNYEKTIGNIIYNTLTPGIATNAFSGAATNGSNKTYSFAMNPFTPYITNSVNWKEAKAIHPTITVALTKGRNYTENTSRLIQEAIVKYLNNIQLSQVATVNDIIITATYADNNATYIINTVNLGSAATNPNTYYYYNIDDLPAPVIAGDTVTLTFS